MHVSTTQQPTQAPTQTSKPTARRPWYLSWWVWVIVIVVVVAAINGAVRGGNDPGSSADAAGGESAGVVVPDLTGSGGGDAADELRELGLSAAFTSDDGSAVLIRSNWVVVSMEPVAGESVKAGSTVTVTVTKPLETTALTDADIQTLAVGTLDGIPITIVGGAFTDLPSELAARSPLAAIAKLVAVAVDTPGGRQYALFASGLTGGSVSGPILGANDAATQNFDWGTAATPESPAGQFIAAVRENDSAKKLIDQVQNSVK